MGHQTFMKLKFVPLETKIKQPPFYKSTFRNEYATGQEKGHIKKKER